MSTPDASQTVTEPIPIFKLAHRYVLYDANHVTYLRREHNISGVLMGTLAQASQQNVFLGLPLELMPEEARLLVEKNVAYVIDDTAEHKRTFLGNGLSEEERRSYQAALRKQGQAAAQDASKRSDDRKKAALSKIQQNATENWNDIPEDMITSTVPSRKKRAPKVETAAEAVDEDESLFGAPANASEGTADVKGTPSVASSAVALEPYGVTPTTSRPLLRFDKSDTTELPGVPPSYPLYKHLHSHGYFMAPGLRFGCQYMAYPGDPLRFHSHFLCNGMDWDQEFGLIDLIGGGRLGTGVKKGFLVGGKEQKPGEEARDAKIRAFGIEWAGM